MKILILPLFILAALSACAPIATAPDKATLAIVQKMSDQAAIDRQQEKTDGEKLIAQAATMPSSHPIIAQQSSIAHSMHLYDTLSVIGGIGLFVALAAFIVSLVWVAVAAIAVIVWRVALGVGTAGIAIGWIGEAITPFKFWIGIAAAVTGLGFLIYWYVAKQNAIHATAKTAAGLSAANNVSLASAQPVPALPGAVAIVAAQPKATGTA